MTGTVTEGAVLPRVEFDSQVCKGCGVCIEACPEDIIEYAGTFNHRGVRPTQLVPDGLVRCSACGNCAVVCPDSAVTVDNLRKHLHFGKNPLRIGDMHYCPGCDEGTVHELLAEVIDELGIKETAVGVASVGCTVFAYRYIDIDWQQAAHGRATSVAWGIECQHPELRVFTVQGDGDLAGIGIGETFHAAARGDPTVIIFLNNAIYGMTGGQLAPTTLMGQVTSTSPGGPQREGPRLPGRHDRGAGPAGGVLLRGAHLGARRAQHPEDQEVHPAGVPEPGQEQEPVGGRGGVGVPFGVEAGSGRRAQVPGEHLFPVYKPGVIKEPPGGMPR